jgi:hypothetical protein
LAEDVLDGVLGAVVLFPELDTALAVTVLADDVEFGVDGEFALGAKFLIWRGVLACLIDGTVCAFGFCFFQRLIHLGWGARFWFLFIHYALREKTIKTKHQLTSG